MGFFTKREQWTSVITEILTEELGKNGILLVCCGIVSIVFDLQIIYLSFTLV